MTFEALIKKWQWRPIRNCPGRYTLIGAMPQLQELLGDNFEVVEFRVKAARDVVIVARFNDGGLISYRRDDGSFIHTLNTQAGFLRKLQQLGIS